MLQLMSMNGRFCLLVLHVALVVPQQKCVQSLYVELQDGQSSVLHSFYMDNCLQSFPTTKEANEILMKLHSSLAKARFEIRQWASNHISVIDHLPAEACSVDTDRWLSHDCTDPCEGILGLSWHCLQNTLSYEHCLVEYTVLTLWVLYRILARQYDPLGFIVPFMTQMKPTRGYDNPDIPEGIKAGWHGKESYQIWLRSKYLDGIVQERTGKIQSSESFTYSATLPKGHMAPLPTCV